MNGLGEALRTLTPFAVAIAASPVAIGVALVILLGRHGRRHIRIFLATWFVAIAAATVAILHLLPVPSTAAPDAIRDPSLARATGVGLLLLASLAAWRGYRARAGVSLVTRLVDRLDHAPPLIVVVVAAVFALNPVNLAVATAGIDAIPGPAPGGSVALLVAVSFAAATSVPLLAVAGVAAAMPSTADTTLRQVNAWLAAHGDTVAAVVLVVTGLWILVG